MLQQFFLDALNNQNIDSDLETSELLDTILEVISSELVENGFVSLDGFGDFTTHKRDEYIALNSKTKERILMPPSIEIGFKSLLSFDVLATDSDEPTESGVLTFEPDLSLISSVNTAFANFEPTVLNEGVELPDLVVVSDETDKIEAADVLRMSEERVAQDSLDTPEVSSISHTRKNRILVPIIGGAAIAMAALLFSNANSNNRRK